MYFEVCETASVFLTKSKTGNPTMGNLLTLFPCYKSSKEENVTCNSSQHAERPSHGEDMNVTIHYSQCEVQPSDGEDMNVHQIIYEPDMPSLTHCLLRATEDSSPPKYIEAIHMSK